MEGELRVPTTQCVYDMAKQADEASRHGTFYFKHVAWAQGDVKCLKLYL